MESTIKKLLLCVTFVPPIFLLWLMGINLGSIIICLAWIIVWLIGTFEGVK